MVVRPVHDARDIKKGGILLRGVAQGLKGGLSTPALRRSATRIGKIVQEEIRKSAGRSFRNPTGALAASFTVTVKRRAGEFDIFVVSRKPYARIQDRGGVITARRARFLTIPINSRAKGRRARDFPKLHRRGKVLFQGDVPLFVLARQVRIKPTRYLEKALANSRARVRRELRKGIRDLSRGARRV